MKNKKLKIILSCILVLVWCFIIFNFSNMDTTESNTKSKDTINKVIDTTIETSNKVGIIENIPTKEEKTELINNLNKPLRKCMHAFIYFILAILVLNALKISNISKNKYLLTIIICFIYALTDEYHQTFINGRTGQFSDVLIDTIGTVIGTIIYKLITDKILQKKQKNDKRNKKSNQKR